MVEFQWPYIQRLIGSPEEIEATAARTGAMTRRRGVANAVTLLRLAFMYAFCGSSLRQTAALAAANEIADISDVALLKRFRKCGPWIGELLGRLLCKHAVATLPEHEYRLRLVDATTVSRPGSKGTDWRIHLGFELATKSISEIELTDASGGETLRRFEFRKNDVVVGDAAYSRRAGLEFVVNAGAFFVVRMNRSNTPLEGAAGQQVEILDLLRGLPDATPTEFPLFCQLGHRRMAVRLVAIRKSEAAAQKSRQKTLRERNKKGNVDPRTLEAAGYIFVLTNLPPETLSTADVLEFYRFRWQIELAFKRLKSIMGLDVLPAKDPQLARMYLLTRLLGAVVIDDLTARYLSFSPWGYSFSGPSFVVACSEDHS
jgi:hypothetical protein